MPDMTKEEYSKLVDRKTPASKIIPNCIKAFIAGGIICCIGQFVLNFYKHFDIPFEMAATATSITMIFLGALLTGLNIYPKIAKFGGAGTIVPITGFANAVVSPAIESKTEGWVLGVGAKIFTIAGPVIVYGTMASFVAGIIYFIMTLFA